MKDITLVAGNNELNIQMTSTPTYPEKWVSPTGHIVESGSISAPERAYDGDLKTYAGWRYPASLILTTEPIMCSGISYLIGFGLSQTMDIDVEYDGIWHNLVHASGTDLPNLTGYLNIVPFDKPHTVTAVRVKSTPSYPGIFELFEVQLWNGTRFPGSAPGVSLVYQSAVRYSPFTVPPLPGWNPEYACGPRHDYQAFEVDVLNVSDTPIDCMLDCYVRYKSWETTNLPWSEWYPDSHFECNWFCGDPWRCCYNAEPYRIKKATIQPGEKVTFRGLCWIHAIETSLHIQAKFVASFGEVVSREILVEGFA